MLGALALVSLPSFYLGVLLITVFSIGLDLLPVTGAGDPHDAGALLQHLVLPSLALGGSTAAVLARMTRSSMLEVMDREFVVAARAKGLAESALVRATP
jgi:peptide/nickel transport system permease protein